MNGQTWTLSFFSDRADVYLSTTDWLPEIGEVWMTFLEDTAVGGGTERRVLFAEALDVDFSIFPLSALDNLLQNADVRSVLQRGVHVIVDKDNFFQGIFTVSRAAEKLYILPTQQAFTNEVNDFWYHAVLATKKLLRGELWIAQSICDGYMKRQLLQLVEWHAKSKHGPHYDTWFGGGRMLEQWADERVIASLRHCFAHYEAKDVRRALLKTMDLFRLVAMETAEQLTYAYPQTADEQATRWVATKLSQNNQT